jgi:hypothetical protein
MQAIRQPSRIERSRNPLRLGIHAPGLTVEPRPFLGPAARVHARIPGPEPNGGPSHSIGSITRETSVRIGRFHPGRHLIATGRERARVPIVPELTTRTTASTIDGRKSRHRTDILRFRRSCPRQSLPEVLPFASWFTRIHGIPPSAPRRRPRDGSRAGFLARFHSGGKANPALTTDVCSASRRNIATRCVRTTSVSGVRIKSQPESKL